MRLKSTHKAKRHQQKSQALESESHEIWQAEAKGLLSNSRRFAMRYPLKIANSFIQAPKTAIFAVYSNFCFLNNFLLKSQNKVLLVLGKSLRSVIYDSAFNSIFPFLVIFGILSPNRVISVNQGFRRFVLFFVFFCFLFLFLLFCFCFFFSPRIYMFCSCQRQIRLLSINTNFC